MIYGENGINLRCFNIGCLLLVQNFHAYQSVKLATFKKSYNVLVQFVVIYVLAMASPEMKQSPNVSVNLAPGRSLIGLYRRASFRLMV
jgi:hypothetical protein